MAVPTSSSSARASTARPSAVTRRDTTDASIRIERDDYQPVFNKTTYIWIGIGVALMVLGMVLMSGGAMPSPDVWDDSIIYSFRRITLAPIVILSGLGVITYAIFKK